MAGAHHAGAYARHQLAARGAGAKLRYQARLVALTARLQGRPDSPAQSPDDPRSVLPEHVRITPGLQRRQLALRLAVVRVQRRGHRCGRIRIRRQRPRNQGQQLVKLRVLVKLHLGGNTGRRERAGYAGQQFVQARTSRMGRQGYLRAARVGLGGIQQRRCPPLQVKHPLQQRTAGGRFLRIDGAAASTVDAAFAWRPTAAAFSSYCAAMRRYGVPLAIAASTVRRSAWRQTVQVRPTVPKAIPRRRQ